MTNSDVHHIEEPRNKNLEAQKSSQAPEEEAKVSQTCGKEVEHLDNQPSEKKASKNTERGASEETGGTGSDTPSGT